jgi:transcriptional regulator with XRE-family HTH domain
MHVMNEFRQDVAANLPTPEQLVGRQVRLLRQGRGWSQQEVAEKMRAFGYKWSQATVTRLESATRPIRVNELADLAMLFSVPATQFLDSKIQELALDDLDALEHEVEKLTAERREVREHLNHQEALAEAAAQRRGAIAAQLARIDGRLEVLMQWVPEFVEIAQGVRRAGDRRE